MKGSRLEKMAEQLAASIEEAHGDGAEVFVVAMCAMVFEEGETTRMHHADFISREETEGASHDAVIIGTLQAWIEELRSGSGETRRFPR